MLLQAVEQMEERLQQFIESNLLEEVDTELDGAARFVQHQVVELARDCREKSVSKHISTSYFCELSDNLERLLHDVSIFSAFEFFILFYGCPLTAFLYCYCLEWYNGSLTPWVQSCVTSRTTV